MERTTPFDGELVSLLTMMSTTTVPSAAAMRPIVSASPVVRSEHVVSVERRTNSRRNSALSKAKRATRSNKWTTVIEKVTVGNVRKAIKHEHTITPVESPGWPAPAEPTEVADRNCWTKRNVRRAKPIAIEVTGKWNYWRSINEPRII